MPEPSKPIHELVQLLRDNPRQAHQELQNNPFLLLDAAELLIGVVALLALGTGKWPTEIVATIGDDGWPTEFVQPERRKKAA